MAKQEERESFLAELRKNGSKLNRRACCSLNVAWAESDQLGHKVVLLENQLNNAVAEINRLKELVE